LPIFFSEDLYLQQLEVINGVKFTPREIDILSFLIAARGASKAASFLNISPHTVFSHVRNIMMKVGRHSREGIIDFLEHGGKIHLLREYRESLDREVLFYNLLEDCLKLNSKLVLSNLVVLCEGSQLKNALIKHFEKQLNRAGFEIKLIDADKEDKLDDTKSCKVFVSERCFSLPETNFLDLGEEKDYYRASIRIVQKLLSEDRFEHLIKKFSEKYNSLKSSITDASTNNEEKLREFPRYNRLPKRWGIMIAAFSAGILLVISEVVKGNKKMQMPYSQSNTREQSIRSDMIIPTESGILPRPDEIAKIDSILNKQNNVQSLAIIGPGGAGKTVLARQYAHQQNAPVVWEINAETPDSLNASFESLAHALATTEESKKMLKEINEIKNSAERETGIIQFVKDHLKSYSDWFLIYDNLERFTDIQKHFPNDPATWGRGKAILTTRDKNIENNNCVNSSIQIQDLKDKEKLDLFLKIMADDEKTSFSEPQKEKTNQFLKNIPPYPLDVSTAAYYLKTTNVSYSSYLENIQKNEREFSHIQHSILKEAGDYTQTRYDIIALSLQRLRETNPLFDDLMLFSCLLNSQDIPRELLEKYKSDAEVDNFIYNLKKYSLLTSKDSSVGDFQTISFHRSTQNLSLAYLTNMIKPEKVKSLLESYTNALDSYTEEVIENEEFSKMGTLLSHLNTFLTHESLLDDKMRNTIRSKSGFIYFLLRHDNKSREILEKCFKEATKSALENPRLMMRILVYLANINMESGNFEKSKELIETCVKDYHKFLKEPHISAAHALSTLGYLYGVLGENEKAKNFLEQSLIVYNQHLPKHYVGGAQAVAYLGNVCWFRGEHEKAKSYLEKSLLIYKKFFPEKYLDIALFHIFLGNTYVSLGEFENAKNALEEGIKVYKKVLPENHIEIAWASMYLADIYMELKRYSEAQEILDKSLQTTTQAVGKNNIRVAWILYHLGKLHIKLGQISRAKELLQQTLVMYKKEYGENHIDVARALKELGIAYFVEGNFSLGEECLSQALKIMKKIDHADYFMILENLAQLYDEKSQRAKKSGNMSEAQTSKKQEMEFLLQAIGIIKNRFPENSPHLQRIQKNIQNLE
jgi:tetratricopeptide (TPR) repeat protein/DNA-binding CsgD family transcriptional regulator